ncbi:2,4-dienoyl-CoA reductase [Sporobacter termitidis DSM 10068]|uniref:2,4-dienoyl-CoA reductase n=1 Tax=Sporobacter termitidis DSM 10068 TaxID=1123282 RepID=A0A1M5YG65_9FIRM|nr:FAD-dependent oxidoreductase [Sporobacter termitidis]SHI11037.1 2,4-dienoyl-CoA reductase [Sporobacter termitidis DSM 10068]
MARERAMIYCMKEFKYPHLFAPITLGNTVFQNRIFGSPTGPSNLSSRHYPTPETCAYYERKAMGGAASVCVGDCSVDAVIGRTASSRLRLDDPGAASSLGKLADAISRHGAVASIELQHGGSHSYGSVQDGNQAYGPVEYTDENGRRVLPMTEEIIEMTIDKFAQAAAQAKRCGFGMVTIHGGHGWLISQFVSPISNTRTDRWGGSVESRCRLPVAICQAVRRAVGPGFPIEIRISGSECHPGGYDIDEGVAIARQLDGHADLIHVSAGSHEVWDVFTVTHPSMFLEDGANVRYAAEIKKHVKQSRVATVGALAVPDLMEEIIASGRADVVEVARGLLADPDLPLKARTGREGDINTCMRCLACFSNLMARSQFLCAINPVIGHETEDKWQLPPAERKKILIAGGGIAGMQAALTACQRGHEVILAERSGQLGGALRCEDGVPFKKHLAEYLDRQARRVAAAAVEVRLNTPVTPALAGELRPDVIIAALGARPVVPKIKGIDGENVHSAEEIYYHPEKAGKRVAILGGGLVGAELGAHLAALGRQVTIIEMLPELNNGGNTLQGLSVGIELRERGVRVCLGTKALEIGSRGVTGEGPEGQELFEADTVIYAIGQKPLREEADALRFAAPEFYQIGDCLTPKNITEATRAAYNIARDIGRL